MCTIHQLNDPAPCEHNGMASTKTRFSCGVLLPLERVSALAAWGSIAHCWGCRIASDAEEGGGRVSEEGGVVASPKLTLEMGNRDLAYMLWMQ